jgi:hypothetical protein
MSGWERTVERVVEKKIAMTVSFVRAQPPETTFVSSLCTPNSVHEDRRPGHNLEESMSGDKQMEKAVTLVMLQPATPAREYPAWMHVPSQPLMRSLLSQFQIPADTSQCSRFFRVWSLAKSPCQADHPVYFGSGNVLEASLFRPSTQAILI